MRSDIVEAIKPVIKNARETAIRLQAEQVASRAQYTADVDQAIATDIAAWLASAGMMVVPVEPTPAMIEATRKMEMPRADNARAMVNAMILGTWAAMLAASPLQNGEVGT